jgi:anti-sigma B factor antagonist
MWGNTIGRHDESTRPKRSAALEQRLVITLEQPISRTILLTLEGSIDEASASDLKRALLEAAQERPERVIVDVTGVESLGSAGLGVLMNAARRTLRKSLALVCDTETTRLLRLLGIDRVAALHSSREEALAA